MATREYYSTRQLVDVDEFLGKTSDSYIMCVSGAMLYALRKLAKTRLLWRTTYAKEKYSQTYLLPDDADWDLIDAEVSAWIAESEVIEVCNNQLISALNNIADQVRLASCCYATGGGYQTINGNLYYGTEAPLDPPTAFGPGEEFETEAAYEAQRCAAANAIINGLIQTLNNFALFELAGITAAAVVAGVAGLGLIAVPPVGLVVAIAYAGLLLGALYSLASAIDTNKADLVCLLYTSDGALDAYESLQDAIGQLGVDLGWVEIEIGAVSNLIMSMVNIDTFNAMYQSVGLPIVPGTTVDCSTECGYCEPFEVTYGTYDPQTEYFASAINTEVPTDREQMYVYFNYDVDTQQWCGPEVTINSITEIIGTPYNVEGNGYRLYNQAGQIVYSSVGTPPASPVSNVARVILINDQAGPPPFTVTIDWS